MHRSRVMGLASVTALIAGSLFIAPSWAATAPTLTPEDGTWVTDTVETVSMPTTRGDRVTSITVDGKAVEANPTLGTSTLEFGVGTNSIEGRYGSYFTFNGDPNQRIMLDEPEYVNGMFEVEVPNEWLVQGENTVHLQTGIFNTSCGANHDDFEIYDIALVTGGPVEAADTNRASYNMGDGSCGSNATLLREAEVSFTIGDDPRSTVGLEGSFDSTELADGDHEVVATTAQGGQTTHTVHVNNGSPSTAGINITDGETLSGNTLVYDVPGENTSATEKYLIDGEEVASQVSGGSGNASFIFTIGSNSSEARYGNYLEINGQRLMLTERDYASETVRIDFPAGWLVDGENTVLFGTGTIQASCGANHDDFAISGISMEFPNGTITNKDVKASYNMGDGLCLSNKNKLLSATMTFDVDVTDGSLSALVDTTQYTDGEHTLSIVDVDGGSTTRHIIIDNNGPQLESSTPAEGTNLDKATTLEASFSDVSGVDMDSLYVSLDGTPVKLGDTVGAGLNEGDHTLVFEVTDNLGHTSNHTVEFTSSTIPGGTVNTSSEHKQDAVHTLGASVIDEGDSTNYDVTFNLANAYSATDGTEGTTVALPEDLDPEASGNVDLAAVATSDEVTDRSPADLNGSWQRFDVEVGQFQPGAMIQWRGFVDTQREAYLRVWNNETSQWDEIQTSRGDLDVTILRGAISEAHVADGVVKAMVVAIDPFVDDMEEPVDEEFEDPADYDFAIAHLSDTQYLSEGAAGDYRADNTDLHPQAERDLWNEAYADVWRWVVDNADERKIAYAAHTGDIIENNIREQTDPAMIDEVEREFEVASANQRILEESGIPNGVLAGNHDNRTGTDGTLYNATFGPDRFEEVSKNWPEDASYGGGWKPGDNQNHYDLFSAGGLDFVAVYLSYGVDDEDVAWANEIFSKYQDRNGLLFSHAYLTTSSEPDGRDAPYSNAGGREQARRIVEANPNVVMTLSGHHHGVGLNVRNDGGEQGNHYVEMLADYQFYEVPVTHPKLEDLRANYPEDKTLRFGSSFFRLLQFDVDRGELVINSYSPFLDEFGANEYDLEQRYDGTEDETRVPIQLSSRSTSLATDDIAVVIPTDTVLGSDSAVANETASIDVDFATVDGLPKQDNVTVGWIAVARNDTGGVISSEYNLLDVDLAEEPVEEPTEPGEEPTEPGQEPTEPGEEPTEPGQQPTEPGAEPTEPGAQPTEPGQEPTEPGQEPTQPGEDPRPTPPPGVRPGLPHTGA